MTGFEAADAAVSGHAEPPCGAHLAPRVVAVADDEGANAVRLRTRPPCARRRTRSPSRSTGATSRSEPSSDLVAPSVRTARKASWSPAFTAVTKARTAGSESGWARSRGLLGGRTAVACAGAGCVRAVRTGCARDQRTPGAARGCDPHRSHRSACQFAGHDARSGGVRGGTDGETTVGRPGPSAGPAPGRRHRRSADGCRRRRGRGRSGRCRSPS